MRLFPSSWPPSRCLPRVRRPPSVLPIPRRPATCPTPRACPTSSSTSSQRPRAYRLFVPPGYDGRRRLPLVLDMHGSGGNAAGEARTSGLEIAGRHRIVPRRDARSGGRPLERARPGGPGQRRHLRRRRHRPRGRAGVYRRDARLRHRLLRRRPHVVAARLPPRLAPGGHRAGVGPALLHAVPGPRAGADVPRPGRSAEHLRRHVPGRNGEWVESVPDAMAGWAGNNHARAR